MTKVNMWIDRQINRSLKKETPRSPKTELRV